MGLSRDDWTEAALDALTHLIEAAPFPMWYRGPDLRLGLVNSAFVAAVQARDAADVITRGVELIETRDEEGARVGAMRAIERGEPPANPSRITHAYIAADNPPAYVAGPVVAPPALGAPVTLPGTATGPGVAKPKLAPVRKPPVAKKAAPKK